MIAYIIQYTVVYNYIYYIVIYTIQYIYILF